MNNLSNLLNKIKTLKKKKQIIGLAHGVFDVLHIGHIHYFNEAKKNVDYLIVSVTDDKFVNKGPGRPVFKINDRVSFLKNLRSVDEVVISNSETSAQIIKLIKPNFYFKGKDYLKNKDLSNNLKKEEKIVKKYGGKIKFTKTPLYSSGKIINENFELITPEAKKFLKKIDKIKLRNDFIKNFEHKNNQKILIIGDPILDTYRYVAASGKSNKGTIISTLYKNEKKYAGGAILAANTLAKFSNKVSMIQFQNKETNKVFNNLCEKNIKKITIKSNLKPINKIRYIDKYSNNKLYQVTLNEDQKISTNEDERYFKLVKKLLKSYENILILDYGYFACNKKIVNLINSSKKNIIINCQANSYNFGFNIFTKYKKSKLMCIDEQEFRLAFKNKNDLIFELFNKNKKILDMYKIFIVTLGKEGCAIRYKKKNYFVPTIFKNALDTIGCGDIFITLFALLSISTKFNVHNSAIISHIAAGIHANEYGNSQSIDFIKLFRTIDNILK